MKVDAHETHAHGWPVKTERQPTAEQSYECTQLNQARDAYIRTPAPPLSLSTRWRDATLALDDVPRTSGATAAVGLYGPAKSIDFRFMYGNTYRVATSQIRLLWISYLLPSIAREASGEGRRMCASVSLRCARVGYNFLQIIWITGRAVGRLWGSREKWVSSARRAGQPPRPAGAPPA